MYRLRNWEICMLVSVISVCCVLLVMYVSPFHITVLPTWNASTKADRFLGTKGGPPSLGTNGGPPSLGTKGGPPSLGTKGGPPSLGTNGGPPSLGTKGSPFVGNLSVYIARDARGWSSQNCDRSRKLRHVSIPTGIGNFTFYVYDSADDDVSVTKMAIHGSFFEKDEIDHFIKISDPLPLIDVGANVGLISLQAAQQGRYVIAVEPIPETALRLCRSALDFGHSRVMRVVGNAVSSIEGEVTLAAEVKKAGTRFEVLRKKGWGFDPVVRWSILLDRLLEVVNFERAALKVDVESHEGHVIAGAEKLFQTVDIRMVWMEWEHVKHKKEHGPVPIIEFMLKHGLQPYSLMSGQKLEIPSYMKWPFTVLWKKSG